MYRAWVNTQTIAAPITALDIVKELAATDGSNNEEVKKRFNALKVTAMKFIDNLNK